MPTMITRRQIDEGRDAPRPAPTPARVVSGSPVKNTRTGTAQSPATPPSPVGGRVTVTVTPSVSGSSGSGTGQPSGARSSSTRANTGHTPANSSLMGNLGIHMGPTTNVGFGAEAAVYSMTRNDARAENFLYANTKDKADDGGSRFTNRSGNRDKEKIFKTEDQTDANWRINYTKPYDAFAITELPELPAWFSKLKKQVCDELCPQLGRKDLKRDCIEDFKSICGRLCNNEPGDYYGHKGVITRWQDYYQNPLGLVGTDRSGHRHAYEDVQNDLREAYKLWISGNCGGSSARAQEFGNLASEWRERPLEEAPSEFADTALPNSGEYFPLPDISGLPLYVLIGVGALTLAMGGGVGGGKVGISN